MKEHEDRAILQPQVSDGRLDLADQLGGGIRFRTGECILQVIDQLRPAGTLRQPGTAAVDSDPHDPGPQGSGRVPATKTTKDTQEDLLRDILGVVAVIQEANAQAVHFRLEAVDKVVNRLGLSP